MQPRRRALLLIVPFTTACGGPGILSPSGQELVDLEATDEGVFLPSLRASYTIFPTDLDRLGTPLLRDDAPKEAAAAPPVRHHSVTGSLAIELQIGGSRGSDSQELSADEFASLGPTTITGPAKVHYDFDLERGVAAIRGGMRIKDRFGIEALIGAADTHAHADLSSGSLHESISTSGSGAYLGGELSLRVHDSWTFYARADYAEVGSDAELGTIELGVRARLFDHLGFFAGWNRWHYVDSEFDSNLELNLSGPLLGLQLTF